MSGSTITISRYIIQHHEVLKGPQGPTPQTHRIFVQETQWALLFHFTDQTTKGKRFDKNCKR